MFHKDFRLVIRKLILSGITVIVSLVAVGFVAELCLRYSMTSIIKQKAKSLGEFIESNPDYISMDTPNGRRLVPNAHVVIRNHYLSRRDILISINSLGFRGPEISKDKSNNELRILILGDSITLGDYLQIDQVYVHYIEEYLRSSFKNLVINVINAGIGDIGLKEEIDILLEQGLSLKPDIVIIAFYLNDSRPPWGFSNEKDKNGFILRYSFLARKFYQTLKLYKWVKDKGEDKILWIKELEKLDWAHSRKDLLRLASLARDDWGAAWQLNSWDIIERYFNKLKMLSRQYDFKVGIIALPVSFQVYAKFIEDTPQRILQEKVVGLGFHYFDLLPLLRNYRNQDLYFDHCHLREKTNEIIGTAVGDFIKREIPLHIN